MPRLSKPTDLLEYSFICVPLYTTALHRVNLLGYRLRPRGCRLRHKIRLDGAASSLLLRDLINVRNFQLQPENHLDPAGIDDRRCNSACTCDLCILLCSRLRLHWSLLGNIMHVYDEVLHELWACSCVKQIQEIPWNQAFLEVVHESIRWLDQPLPHELGDGCLGLVGFRLVHADCELHG